MTIADSILEATKAVPLARKGEAVTVIKKTSAVGRTERVQTEVKITLPESLGEGFGGLFED